MSIVYNVYIGQFTSPEDSKSVQLELNKHGYRAVCYNLGLYYSLRISTYSDYQIAYKVLMDLKKVGFNGFIYNI